MSKLKDLIEAIDRLMASQTASVYIVPLHHLHDANMFLKTLLDSRENSDLPPGYADRLQYRSPTSLIELRPTAFETSPNLIACLQKLFEKGDRMVVPIGKVPVTGDTMQIGSLTIDAVQVILRIGPKPGEPVATVYVKVHV